MNLCSNVLNWKLFQPYFYILSAKKFKNLVVQNYHIRVSYTGYAQLKYCTILDLIIIKKKIRNSIFISRFAASTSVDDIINCICNNTNSNLSHSIRSYKYKTDVQKEISSFRITTPQEYFNSLISTTFWPDGTLVNEFIP